MPLVPVLLWLFVLTVVVDAGGLRGASLPIDGASHGADAAANTTTAASVAVLAGEAGATDAATASSMVQLLTASDEGAPHGADAAANTTPAASITALAGEARAADVANASSLVELLTASGNASSPAELLALAESLRGNLTSFSDWDYNRCKYFPWELHCLDPHRICPYMPWLPQCRHAQTPAPAPAPAPAPWVPPAHHDHPPPAPAPSGNVKTLYHQTSPEIAALILQGEFRPGTQGWCGGGIYFATSASATDGKAIGPDSHHGFIIEARVDVGRTLHMPNTCDRSLNSARVSQQGYDSIAFNPGDGEEYVIYDPHRVLSKTQYHR